jgi:hypothetical protein
MENMAPNGNEPVELDAAEAGEGADGAAIAPAIHPNPEFDAGRHASLWFGERFPLRIWPQHVPSEGLDSDAWLLYRQEWYEGRFFRFFMHDDEDYALWSGYGYPRDGSPVLNWKTKKAKDTFNGLYPAIQSSQQSSRSGGQVRYWLPTHIAVAYLWGAVKRTAHPMSELLVVDHRVSKDEKNYKIEDLQIITSKQNKAKQNDKVFAPA